MPHAISRAFVLYPFTRVHLARAPLHGGNRSAREMVLCSETQRLHSGRLQKGRRVADRIYAANRNYSRPFFEILRFALFIIFFSLMVGASRQSVNLDWIWQHKHGISWKSSDHDKDNNDGCNDGSISLLVWWGVYFCRIFLAFFIKSQQMLGCFTKRQIAEARHKKHN